MTQQGGRPSAERVAYHEAGHVVVGHVLGKTLDYVTIQAALIDVAGHTFGHTRWLDMEDGSADPIVLVALAGSAAEARQMGEAEGWARSDERRRAEHLLRMAKKLGKRDGPANITPEEEATADAILQEHWPAVEALAKALMMKPTLGRQIVADIVTRASGRR